MVPRAEAFTEAECFRSCSVDGHINRYSPPASLRRLELPHTQKLSTIHFTICGSHLNLQNVQLGFKSMVQSRGERSHRFPLLGTEVQYWADLPR